MLSVTGELYEAVMSQLPMMPVYPDALIADTTHLSAEEFGAYWLILMATWRNNGRPYSDDRDLAHICRVSLKKWRGGLRQRLLPFFDLSDGKWFQKRLNLEWDNASKLAAISRSNGARARSGKANNSANGTNPAGNPAGVLPNHPEGTQSPTIHIHSHKKESPNGASYPPFPPKKGGGQKPNRLSPDWQPDLADRAFCTDFGFDPDSVLAEFRDYWLAKPTKATKLDWSATFRNWCRRKAADGQRPPKPSQSPGMNLWEGAYRASQKGNRSDPREAAEPLLGAKPRPRSVGSPDR